ncbi:hypothetical protein OF83DRAFT_420328 [Amylostereum chailletii]|nr:hypothetical protein OF83DRAFT_420328 [Amylostereum chailletii]
MFPTNLSLETMDEVVLHAVALDALEGPPSALRSLCLTSRRLHSTLSVDATPSLYSRLFQCKFDISAAARRLSPQAMEPAHLASELRSRFMALKVIRAGDMDHPDVTEALLVAHVMLLENDGKNAAQLRWARLGPFLDAYLATRLHSTPVEARGWPAESEANSLVIALLAQWMTQDDLISETQDHRARVMSLLAPFSFAGFRYNFVPPNPASTAPMIDWQDVRTSTKDTVRQLPHFGSTVLLNLPSIARWACLSYLARMQMYPLIPYDGLPLTRAERAESQTTVEDMEEYNEACRTLSLLPQSSSLMETRESSRMYDAEWARTLSVGSGEPSAGLAPSPLAPYTLGCLTGDWRGTQVIPSGEQYTALQAEDSHWTADSLVYLARQPVFCTLQENYRRKSGHQFSQRADDYDSTDHVPVLSPRMQWTQEKGGVSVYDAKTSHKTQTGAQTKLGPPVDTLSDISEIIVSGKTEARHGAAWGAYTFKGTVRPSDGLVLLLREPEVGGNATNRGWFVGYVTAERTLVGKWNLCASGSGAPPCEGIWNMCKKHAAPSG